MMNTNHSWRQLGMALLLLAVCWIVPQRHAEAHQVKYDATLKTAFDLTVDGTQLVEETKQLVADHLRISPSEVTATYCCQLLDGRFKYSASAGLQNGFVYWTVVNGQIIEEDIEGF